MWAWKINKLSWWQNVCLSELCADARTCFQSGSNGLKIGQRDSDRESGFVRDRHSILSSVHCIISTLKEHNNEHSIPLHKCVQKAPKHQKHVAWGDGDFQLQRYVLVCDTHFKVIWLTTLQSKKFDPAKVLKTSQSAVLCSLTRVRSKVVVSSLRTQRLRSMP